MYDWPELTANTDWLWQVIAKQLQNKLACQVPAGLSRAPDPHLQWQDPKLLLGQACGLPLVRELGQSVAVLGSPSYRLEGANPGCYCSVIIAPRGAAKPTAVINDRRSQSGFAALLDYCEREARELEPIWVSGSHRQSIRAVADGAARIAAIDEVSWALAKRYEPQAKQVRVLGISRQTSGLPIISGQFYWQAQLQELLEDCLGNLPGKLADALLIDGFTAWEYTDYQPLGRRFERLLALAESSHPGGEVLQQPVGALG